MEEIPALACAFPVRLHGSVDSILAAIPGSGRQRSSDDIGALTLEGERLRVPARIYLPEPNWSQVASLDVLRRSIAGCLYSRHHDGYVRERALAHIPLATESWAAPFVIQLLGDYVIEIVERAAAMVNGLSTPGYAAFVDENPTFLELTSARATSYWNEYHRHRFPNRGDYPAFRGIDTLRRSRPAPEPPSKAIG